MLNKSLSMENLTQNKDSGKGQYFITFPTYLLQHLTAQECVICGLLASLSTSKGWAFPSNRMLAETMSCSIETIQRVLLKLEKEGYIIREQDKGYGRKVWVTSKMIGGNLKSDIPPTSNLTPPSPQILGTDIKDYTNKVISSKDKYDPAFEEVWKSYEKRGVKTTSYSAWKRLPQKDKDAVIKHVPEYVHNHLATGNIRWLPHFSTYLNQRRWEDELPYELKVSQSPNVSWD